MGKLTKSKLMKNEFSESAKELFNNFSDNMTENINTYTALLYKEDNDVDDSYAIEEFGMVVEAKQRQNAKLDVFGFDVSNADSDEPKKPTEIFHDIDEIANITQKFEKEIHEFEVNKPLNNNKSDLRKNKKIEKLKRELLDGLFSPEDIGIQAEITSKKIQEESEKEQVQPPLVVEKKKPVVSNLFANSLFDDLLEEIENNEK